MNENERFIHDRLPEDFYRRIETGNFIRQPYPVFADRDAWEKVRSVSKYAPLIIAEADAIEENSVPQLLFSNYSQFRVNGNRSEYEKPYFDRRKNLAFLALAMCLTGDKEKYMSRLLDHVIAILEEWNWCLPAHIIWGENGPDEWRICDLFCAETGAVMAQFHAILGDEIDKEFPGLSEIIREKTLDRTVYNVLLKGISHWWHETTYPANWTVWCSYNNLATAFCLEKDNRKLAYFVKRYLEPTSRFIHYYPEDGYCAEGPSYYNKANLMVFRTLFWLHKSIPGSMDKLFAEPKIKNMVEFIANVRIGGKYQVSFGDAQPILRPDFSSAVPAGVLLNSPEMQALGLLNNAVLGACGDFLKEALALLFDQPETLPEQLSPGAPVTLFENRLAILRSEGFSASLKTGNNEEPHNHNDLGHFSLFNGSEPVIVDAGTGRYAKINFSPLRYTLWNTRGNGHNAPVFGEYEQLSGREYTAGFSLKDGHIVCSDLSKAYPAAAGVKRFERKLDFSKDQVIVEDDFELEKSAPAVITLLCTQTPVQKDAHTIQLGDVTLKLEGIAFDSAETMPDLIFSRSGKDINIWGDTLTALRLRSENNSYKLIFQK